MSRDEYNIRPGSAANIRAAFDVSMLAMKDLFLRQGTQWNLEPEQFWFAMFSLTGEPKHAEAGALDVVTANTADIDELAAIERAVIGYARNADYPWLLQHREVYEFRRGRRPVGFGCFSDTGQGPIVALEPDVVGELGCVQARYLPTRRGVTHSTEDPSYDR